LQPGARSASNEASLDGLDPFDPRLMMRAERAGFCGFQLGFSF
jgi:hypothetical protein